MFNTLSYNLLKSVNNTCKKCTSRGDVTYTCKKVLEVFFTELYSTSQRSDSESVCMYVSHVVSRHDIGTHPNLGMLRRKPSLIL